ncbi:ATP-binding protein [Magnetospirillum fulvum]|uniref:histidine kinase n=1 Tax=Magnetospirillum fulvum MGU-K5 TaxID=1316936 RepID=S9TWW1_MAGFU|nr:ATP-binding protein [Magnetospirillum fulvum]EPY02900.1 Signal transduction histidine kinase [Magnetospirillum fulvum MGU-K5]
MINRNPAAVGRLLSVAVLLSSPTGIVLLVLAAQGSVHVAWAVLVWLGVTLILALLVRAHLTRLAALAEWVRSMAMGAEPGPPPGRDDVTLAGTAIAVGGLRRVWQQKTAELTSTARWNESLLDNLPDPLLLLDPTRRVVRANKAARLLFGRELGGRDITSFLRHPSVLEAIEAVLAGASGRECEFTQPVPLERVFLARVVLPVGLPPDGAAAMLTLHDLTDLKRIERMRADFVANASHELRTPLAAVAGFIETLRGPARDDEEARDRFLAIMAEQAQRMSRLIADLLSLSRIELNEHTPPSEKVDLGRLLITAAEVLRPLAQGRGMEIVLEIAPDLDDIVGQPDELAQLFQNLLDNALKYGRENSAVRVVACAAAPADLPVNAGPALKSGPAVKVSVRDQGEGIAREHLPRLTERFYRADTARSRRMGGTGLGLAIVKHIVNRHRGLLTIDSVVGQGSTFTVWLPAAER